MKKLITSIIAMLLAMATLFAVGCGKNKKTEVIETDDQLAALTEIQAGTSDIAVIDSVMANYYVNKPNFSDLMILTGEDFTFANEYYAIGSRKNTNTDDYINAALYQLQVTGKLTEIATKYGLQDVICTISEPSSNLPAPSQVDANSDFGKILAKGELVLGYTIFEPIAYMNGTTLIGFDIELAKAVCDLYGLSLKNQKINWETKEDELNSGNIDVIWNGFTWTEERAQNLDFSAYYMTNRQAIVIRKADKDEYTDYASMKGATFACESESAGESTIREIILPKVEA